MRVAICFLMIGWMTSTVAAAEEWKPAAGPLLTRWAKDVSPDKAHAEYPRPQLVREQWTNLNGLWNFALADRGAARPAAAAFSGKILVPFPIESALSGVKRMVGEKERLWYQRTFSIPAAWAGQRVLLHFGAVDWEAQMWVNGKPVGEHRGGYDPFTLDITSALRSDGMQELVVAVDDPTDNSTQPRGKQVRRPHGIWYTPTTGIWQTVWLEPVPAVSIAGLKITPDIDRGEVVVQATAAGDSAGATLSVRALDGDSIRGTASGPVGEPVRVKLEKPKLWSPDEPFLYDLKIELQKDGRAVDRVASYCGMRKIAIGKDEHGVLRLMLNNRPLFQFGPLDQGFWPDGLYTAPTDEALRYDIEITRKLGFNMCRKHVKVEPDRWYYWCDKLGLLVWQDMPSGDRYIGGNDPDVQRSPESAQQYETELRRMIDAFGNHPCIVMWVPFNEGWGQFDTGRIADWIKKYDPTRLVNSASGWTDRGVGDVHDIHVYPGPGSPPANPRRAAVLGEFGGLGLPLKGHTWQDEKNWGYRSFTSAEELTVAYEQLITRLRPLIQEPGLTAAVYTQTTDVEIEVNGLLTYDRAVLKMPLDRVAAVNRKVYLPPPTVKEVVPTARKTPITWRYSTAKPSDQWMSVDFGDGDWKEGPGGFGEASTPGAVVRTPWKSSDIWIRRTFELPADAHPRELQLLLHHDEDAEVYLNGKLAAKVTGYTTDYAIYPLSADAAQALKPGQQNSVAIHCHQTGGGQYIDMGLVEVHERK